MGTCLSMGTCKTRERYRESLQKVRRSHPFATQVKVETNTEWGPGVYMLFAAMSLRFLDLVVFAVAPVRRRATPWHSADGGKLDRAARSRAPESLARESASPLLATSRYESLFPAGADRPY